MTPEQFALLSTSEIENVVDIGLRHKRGSKPFDYLQHWLGIGRLFGYATRDNSWGEFEKIYAVIIKRLVVAERDLERFRTVMGKGAYKP